MCVRIYVHVSIHACISEIMVLYGACMYVCMFACIHVCVFVCMYACIYVFRLVCVCLCCVRALANARERENKRERVCVCLCVRVCVRAHACVLLSCSCSPSNSLVRPLCCRIPLNGEEMFPFSLLPASFQIDCFILAEYSCFILNPPKNAKRVAELSSIESKRNVADGRI